MNAARDDHSSDGIEPPRRVGGLDFLWHPAVRSEPIVRTALVLLLAPLPIACSPNPEPRQAETAPPAFSLEDRLAFGRGLGERSASQTRVLMAEQSIAPIQKPDAVMGPGAEEDRQQPTSTTFEAGGHENSPAMIDERRWSLPFGGMNYAVEDLPTTPDASFQTGVIVSVATKKPATVIAQNDGRVAARIRRPKLRIERQIRVPVRPRVVRLESLPPAVQAAILQQQAMAAPPPFPFFLGAPPQPAPKENTPPKKPFSLPQSVHDVFKNEY